jgi:hypothetical protein
MDFDGVLLDRTLFQRKKSIVERSAELKFSGFWDLLEVNAQF